MNPTFARFLAIAFCLGLAACKPTQTATPAAGPPPAVGVVAAQMKGIRPALGFIGRIKAVNTVQVRARVEGFLEKTLFREGQYVKTGDLLYQIEKTQYQASVDQANANVAAAQAVEVNAQIAFNRASDLVKTSAGTVANVDQTRANLDSAKASVLQNQAAQAIAQLNLSYTDITSPIVGRIGISAYTLGNLVNPASGVLATIVSDDPIYAEFPVSMRQIDDIAAGHNEDLAAPFDIKAFLTLANGKQYDQVGAWNFVSNQVDTGTDTLLVRAVFANPKHQLVDGAFVTVKIEEADEQPRLVIPRAALLLDQQGVYVLVVNNDQKVEVKRVTTGEAVNTDIAIASGLQVGDRVIIDGIQKVHPGQTVQATLVAPADGAAK
jgi:membrane fusion protein, multidrug efflux system